MKFEKLKIGPCKGIFIWGPPPREKFLSWLSQLKMYIDTRKISVEVYLVGTYLETPWDAHDVDVILTHPEYDEADHKYKLKIRDVIIYGIQTGLSMNMYIDMDFYIPFKKDGTFWYSSKEFQETGNRIDARMLTITDNPVIVSDEDDEHQCSEHDSDTCKRLDEHLFEITSKEPSDKHIEKIKNGILYEDPKLLFQTIKKTIF